MTKSARGIDPQAVTSLPIDLARRIGAIPGDDDLPTTQLDWALRWATRGLRVFPCVSILGRPLVKRWYSAASDKPADIVEWWSADSDADIGAVPDLSGHYVISVIGEDGEESFAALEDRHGKLTPEFETSTRWKSRHLWFKGRAHTSCDLLGAGLNVIGPGRYIFLPDSLAPDNYII